MRKGFHRSLAVILSFSMLLATASPAFATETNAQQNSTQQLTTKVATDTEADSDTGTVTDAETNSDTEALTDTEAVTDTVENNAGESELAEQDKEVEAAETDNASTQEIPDIDSTESGNFIVSDMLQSVSCDELGVEEVTIDTQTTTEIEPETVPQSETAADSTEEDIYVPVTEDAFLKAPTLKGIQGNAAAGDHYFMNCLLQTGFQIDSKAGKAQGGYKAHEYKGKTYYFQLPTGIDYGTIQYCNANNKTVSIEFLLQYDPTKTRLIDPESRVPGYAYYAPNMSTASVKEEYEAFFDFLAKEFSKQDCHIDNWILGNEVNMGNSSIGYHYTGGSKSSWPTKYANYFKVVYGAVRTYTSATRVSVCLDHSWNDSDQGRGISGKSFLKSFAKIVGKKTDWSISYHCYPAVLFETKIWQPSAIAGVKLNPDNSSARFVDGANLKVMTNYVKKTYGKNHRIMLTEQGFSNYQGSKAQAAAFVYTYYAAKFDDMVDCMILHVANDGDKLNFQPGSFYSKCYTKIDTGKASDVKWINKKILPIIGVKDWKEIIPDYKESILKANVQKITAFVNNLYLYGLGRKATAAETNSLVLSIKSGKTTAANAAKKVLLSSASKKQNSSNEMFVKAAYTALYGKAPSSSKVSKYLKEFKKKHTRKYVLKLMVEDKKFKSVCNSAGMDIGSIKAKK